MMKTVCTAAMLCLLGSVAVLHAADGRQLYAECVKCHGEKGEKTLFSRAIGGWNQQEVKQALLDYRSGNRNLRGQGSIMRQRVAGYSNAQINALAAYISTLR
jgi:cytochrome c553